MNFADPVYQPFAGRPFVDGVAQTHNSQIQLNVTSTRRIHPSEYLNDDWPKPGNPAVQAVSACTANYSSYNGWFCGQTIGSVMGDSRLYLKDMYTYRMDPNVLSVPINQSRTADVTFFDRAGLPVPDKSAIFGGGYYFGGDLTVPPTTTQNTVKVTFYSGQGSCYGSDTSLLMGVIFAGVYNDPSYALLPFNSTTPYGFEVPPYPHCPGY